MTNLRFSIITVVYNSAKTITRTIESVIGQNYPNIEYLIIDGNSTDGTVDIIRKYHDRITRWVSEPDEGIYDAMNKGISMATGDVIAFLNSDDWYEKEVISYIAGQFEKGAVDIVFAGMNAVWKDGRTVPHIPDLSRIHKISSLYHPSTFSRSEVFKKFGNYDVQYAIAADYEWMLRVLAGNAKVMCVDKITSNFTIGGASCQCLFRTNAEAEQVAIRYARNQDEAKEIRQCYEESNKLLFYREKLPELSHIFKDINFAALPEDRRISIFGAGTDGQECFELLSHYKIAVYGFVDNDKTRWGSSYKGIEILPLQKMDKNKDYILIATYNYEKEIEEQLQREGYEKGKHYGIYTEIIQRISKALEEKFGKIDFSKEAAGQ